MKTSIWRRWFKSMRGTKPTGPVSRRKPRRTLLCLEALEDRVTPSLTPHMVLDINPGPASSNPSQMVAIGSTTYFAADDGVHGVELWKSDGTALGTTLVKDIYPGGGTGSYGAYYLNSSFPSNLTNVNGTLFFTADVGHGGPELWKSDGTEAGTVKLSSSVWYPQDLTNVNGTLFFSGNDGTHGWELWKSDGTVAGTTLVKDIYPGGFTGGYGGYYLHNSSPSNLTNVNGTLFFSATDGTHGCELWKSDGTEAGTVLVKDVYPGGYTGYNGRYYANSSNPGNLTDVNGTLFFTAEEGHARELCKSDGSAAGTVLVKDISLAGLTNLNGTLFFAGYDGTNGSELWKSDGTAAGTVLVKDINPGSAGSNPWNLTNVNGTLFFAADDGVHGVELWKSDGTVAGTTLVKDIYPGSHWQYFGGGSYGGWWQYVQNSSNPSDLTNVNGTLFFNAYDGTSAKLWQSDGTEAGTVPVANLIATSLTNVNGTLFFAADDGVHGQELWMLVDGPAQGTSLNVSGFPGTVTAGAAGSLTITAKNSDGTTATGYTGTVHFSSSDGLAALPADYTFQAADAGVHTFSATLRAAGTQSLTAAAGTVTGSETGIAVTPAAANKVIVVAFPSPTTAGAAGNFTVTLEDPYGNLASGYRGTVHFASSDSKAALPATYTFTSTDAGVHTFSATLKTAGAQSITATDTVSAGLTGTDGNITVNPAAGSKFILTAPASVNAGPSFSLTLKVEDAYGNVVTGYTGTVHFSSTDKKAALPSNYTFTTADKGVHTFSGLALRTKGNQKITITDTHKSLLTGSVIVDVL